MNVLLTKAVCLSGLLSISLRASDVESTGFGSPVHQEESGVLTHGTISAIKPDRIVVLTPGSRELIPYFHGEGTVYVDESGDPIMLDVVKSGVPVTVFYSQAEDQRMANRVIVGKT
ncbi:MAG: hypothetical protein ABL994_13410 [Verrucomicrobiales bacterium]